MARIITTGTGQPPLTGNGPSKIVTSTGRGGFTTTPRAPAPPIPFNGPANISQGFPPSFVQTQLGGCELWLRADRGVVLSNISQWNDSSGAGDNNRHVVQGVLGNQPSLNPANPKLNFQPSVDFLTAFGQELDMIGVPSVDPHQPYWMVIVAYDTDFTRQQGWVGDLDVNNWYLASFWNSAVAGAPPNYFGASNATVISIVEDAIIDTGAPVIYMTEFNDPTSTIRVNSTEPLHLIANPPQTPAGTTGVPNPLGRLRLGGTFGSANTLNGSIGFIVAGQGLLSDADRRALLTWLSVKFNIPLRGTPGRTISYPTNLPRIFLVFDPAKGITGGVRAWVDQSGKGDSNRNFLQTAASHRPTLGPAVPLIGGKPALLFQNSTQFLSGVGAWAKTVSQPYTIIVVGADTASGSEVFVGQSDANNWYMAAVGGVYGVSAAGPALNGTTPDSVSPKILCFEYNDPTSTVVVNALTPEATGPTGAGNLPVLALGAASGGGGAPMKYGLIAEVLVYSRLLSAQEKTLLLQQTLGPYYNIAVGG